MCCRRLAENTGCKNSPSGHHCTTSSGCIFTTKVFVNNRKKYVLHMFLQYGELRPTNGWDQFTILGQGHLIKFQRLLLVGFVTAATSLNKGQPNFARCLDVFCAGTLYTFSGALAPWWNFSTCKIHFTSKSCVLLYWQHYCTALLQRVSAILCGMVQGMELWNFRRRHHLYSAGRPSRWASAHISSSFFFSSPILSGQRLNVYHTSTCNVTLVRI